MDKEIRSNSLDILEGYEDGQYPWAKDTLKDWTVFVQNYGAEEAAALLKRAVRDWPPETLALDISTKCNLRCPMCASNGDEEGRAIYTRRQFDWRVIADFIIRSGGVKTLSIGSLGESFLKRDTLLFMEAVKDYVADFAFGTNATAIDSDYIQELAKYRISSIRISCDAGDRESYPIWRRGADFDTFATNTREFARLFGDKVAIHSVLFRENMESLKKVPDLAREVGIGMVEIHSLRRKGAAIRHGLHCADLDETVDFFNAVLPRAEELGVRIVPIISFPDADTARRAYVRTKGRIGHRDFYREVSAGRCGDPFRFLNIAHHGELSPCCGGVEGEKLAGNPFTDYTAHQLFNSRAILLLRAMTMAGYTPSACQFYCRKCYRPPALPGTPPKDR